MNEWQLGSQVSSSDAAQSCCVASGSSLSGPHHPNPYNSETKDLSAWPSVSRAGLWGRCFTCCSLRTTLLQAQPLPSAATVCCSLAFFPAVVPAGSASPLGSVRLPGSPSGGCWSPRRPRARAGRAQARAARRCSCTGHAGLGVPGGARRPPAPSAGPQSWWPQ